MSPGDDTDVDVSRYLRGLWRRRILVLLTVLLVVNVSLALSLQQDRVYEGEARLLLSPQMFGDRTSLQLDAALAVHTEIQILESEPVRALVAEDLGPVGEVTAERVGQTLLISVKARAGEAKRAADVANAYARTYIRFRGELGGSDPASGVPQSDVSTGGTAELVSTATVPDSPVTPNPIRDSLLAGVLGILVAVGLASLLEALDDSLKTRDELRKTAALPVLGVIPVAAEWHATASPEEIPPAVGEAFRSLRTSVQLLGVDRPIRTLQVTSAGTGDGKTTVVANLAFVLAGMGQKVAMVDGDLRCSRLHELFGLRNEVGVTSVLSGEVPVMTAIQPVHPDQSLVLLAAGPAPPNPSELLASKKMAELIFALSDQFDVVIIDSPPVLAVTDAILLTTWAEAVILVAASGHTRRKHLQTTLELLRQAEAPLVGAVLNRATAEDGGSKYHSYYQEASNAAADRLAGTPASGNGSTSSRESRNTKATGNDDRTGSATGAGAEDLSPESKF